MLASRVAVQQFETRGFFRSHGAVSLAPDRLWVGETSSFHSKSSPRDEASGPARCPHAVYENPFRVSGNSRTRFPVAAKIALQMAGAIGGTPGSPTPAGGAKLSTMCTST